MGEEEGSTTRNHEDVELPRDNVLLTTCTDARVRWAYLAPATPQRLVTRFRSLPSSSTSIESTDPDCTP